MGYFYSPFRSGYSDRIVRDEQGCPFCDKEVCATQAVCSGVGAPVENKHYMWLVNWFPKFEGHTMLVPKRHIKRLDEETKEEASAFHCLLKQAITGLSALYPDSGVEVFLQTGLGSASSVTHLHWHVVPAQKSDLLRGFEKLGHFYTLEANKERVLLFPIDIVLARESLQQALRQHVKE